MIAFNSQYSRYLWTRDINVTKGWINTRAYWPTSLFHHCDVAIYLCLFAHFEQRQVFGSDHFLAARTLVFPYPGLTPGPSHNKGPPGVRPSSRCCFRCCSCQRNQREIVPTERCPVTFIYMCLAGGLVSYDDKDIRHRVRVIVVLRAGNTDLTLCKVYLTTCINTCVDIPIIWNVWGGWFVYKK